MYYVYEWFIVDTNEIIYVGKGIRNRYKVRKHNKFFNDMIMRFKCDSRIVKEFEDEKDAFEYEYDRICELKAKGQCVCNIYNGGSGGTTSWWTDNIRERYSQKNVMKSIRQRDRMSKNNPMHDETTAEKVNSKKRKPVIIGETEYKSVKDVCKIFRVSPSAINSWCTNGHTPDGTPCHYKNKNGDYYTYKNDGQKKPLKYKGKHYSSTTEAALELGVSQTTVSRWCRNGRDSCGNACRYDDDQRLEVNSPDQKQIPVIVNDVWYPSKEKARKALGITTYTLTQYLDGKKIDDKYICRYGNQQPSQGNTDNSTLEGSTTNE